MTQARRVRLVLRRIEPMTVLRFSLLLFTSLYLVLMVAAASLWVIASITGLRGNVESFVGDLIASDDFRFLGGQMLQASLVGGIVTVLLASGIAVLLSVLHNLVSDLTGGFGVVFEEPAPPATRSSVPKGRPARAVWPGESRGGGPGPTRPESVSAATSRARPAAPPGPRQDSPGPRADPAWSGPSRGPTPSPPMAPAPPAGAAHSPPPSRPQRESASSPSPATAPSSGSVPGQPRPDGRPRPESQPGVAPPPVEDRRSVDHTPADQVPVATPPAEPQPPAPGPRGPESAERPPPADERSVAPAPVSPGTPSPNSHGGGEAAGNGATDAAPSGQEQATEPSSPPAGP